jgi:hypothetical protein
MGSTRASERGQVIPLVIIALITLIGMCALVMDVGYAYYAKRQLQASVDAAALAGAQNLPDTSTATTIANRYVSLNTPANIQNATWSVTTRCSKAGGLLCNPANTLQVKETAHLPTVFARLFGIKYFDLNATATACQPCSIGPADIMVTMDRTGSMCTPLDSNGWCYDLDNAKDGVRTLLSDMTTSADHVGMIAFPPVPAAASVCSAPVTKSGQATYYDDPTYKFLTDSLSWDYKNPDGSLNMSAGLLAHTVDGPASSCITDGGTTSYAQALQQAGNVLLSTGRPGVQKIIIFMTDGEANIGPVFDQTKYPGVNPPNGPENMQPCHTAENVATTLKNQGITIYTIGYDLRDQNGNYANCQHGQVSNGKHTDSAGNESPSITSLQTLQNIASPGNFYDKPNGGQLNTIFTAIAEDITAGTSKLVDDNY